ncbi:MAG TPA: VCBS repeat-containing protein [Panacibacter sp.]|nr:VCBS repeat-containing protein [Panacibacter sp.]HNP43847.1 VCBS repeat-containing protein [Panacibacter sp.]
MNNISTRLLSLTCIVAILVLTSCKGDTVRNNDALFTLMPATGINFENNVADKEFDNSFLFRNFYNGGGVAIGDLNNDSLPDVFFTSNMADNKLYLNKGNFQFDDITAKSGIKQDSMWSTGVLFVDINNDGWLDIYVCNSGHMSTGHRRNQLFINNHNLTFTESAKQYGLDISAYSTQVSFFDFDNDGDLDCFMINNSPIPVNQLNYIADRDKPQDQWKVGEFLKGGGDHLFKNDNGHFTEITKEAGIHGSLISFGLGVSVGDINNDGWPDVYVSNDSYERDYLYINQRDGTFKDEFESYFQHTSMSSMGTDIADINNDGYPDLFTTDMLPGDDYRLKTMGAFDNIDLFNSKIREGLYYQYVKNCLQLNNRNGKFIDIGNYSGVSATDWSWGELMFDADNDGYTDLYVCNGVNRDVTDLDFMDFFANDVFQKMVLTGQKDKLEEIVQKIPKTPILNKVYKNNGDLRFIDIGETWGFTQKSFSNGAAYGDLDNDGDLDLVINNENGPSFVYRNNSREVTKNNYLSVTLKGDDINTYAIGSKIQLFAGQQIFTRELIPCRGFQSSVDYKQVIGLGKIGKIDSMVITWPNRTVSSVLNPTINTTVYLTQSGADAKQQSAASESVLATYFDSTSSVFEKHTEDDFTDFYYERALPKMLSREGPKAATADVNKDGLVDVYIAGTPGHSGQIYLQRPGGAFIKKDEPAFKPFADFEDEALLFFDADGDSDPDLLIGPGGNNNPPYSRQMQNRLFLNDGTGTFSLKVDAFENNKQGVNTGAAIALDFNHDGHLDIFIGGRSEPAVYGMKPNSTLYLNDGSAHFKDVTKAICPAVSNIGMVTSAALADINGDNSDDLIITGEWMTPRIFSFKNGFTELRTNLQNLYGWWQTIKAVDVNGDGKMDVVLGNIGENFYLHPSEKEPVKLFVNDFDKNGYVDKILTSTIGGKDMPVFLKRDMEEQIPYLKKQSLRHEQFAVKSVQELFPADAINQSTVDSFNYCASIVAINDGKGNFIISKLPAMAQLSSVNAIQPVDVNGDGHPDLVIGGNENGFLPQFERLDASFGDLLLNDGKGNFSWVEQKQSGFMVNGVVRDIALFSNAQKQQLLFLVNNGYPALYSINKNRK